MENKGKGNQPTRNEQSDSLIQAFADKSRSLGLRSGAAKVVISDYWRLLNLSLTERKIYLLPLNKTYEEYSIAGCSYVVRYHCTGTGKSGTPKKETHQSQQPFQ